MNIFENRDYSFSTKNKDEEGAYTLSEAKELCTTLEDGWRVPTCEELEIIRRDFILKGLSTLMRDLNLKIDKSCYLTDTYDEYDGWPVTFSFNDGSSYISSEKSKHSLRLVRNEGSMSAEKKLSNEDFIQNIILVFKKYVPGLSEEKFTQFMVECIAGEGEFENIRYVTLEDYNMCTDSEGFYTAHFHQDNDLLFIWEDDFYSCGYTPDELEEDGIRNTYIGFIDLKDKKYIRVNGYGDEIEYGSDNPADEHPDWKEWC